jgi:hypothetical protein
MNKLNTNINMAEPSREKLRQLGRDALASKFRSAALQCTLKFSLNADDINEVACEIAREIEAYTDE